MQRSGRVQKCLPGLVGNPAAVRTAPRHSFSLAGDSEFLRERPRVIRTARGLRAEAGSRGGEPRLSGGGSSAADSLLRRRRRLRGQLARQDALRHRRGVRLFGGCVEIPAGGQRLPGQVVGELINHPSCSVAASFQGRRMPRYTTECDLSSSEG
ncbi:unnamed protein product [Trichogramma brassicae]|uniref:Uncharacterized protein n=1 Tax=Trichogramma brassicae TaxID=86971 RepID=A0A6H5IH57_9HYME|nr:unnamed protein product [Trichogramma brassicae]